MMSFSDLVDEVSFQLLYKCPTELIIQGAARAVVRFCRETAVLSEEFVIAELPPIPNGFEVLPAMSADGYTSSIKNVKSNGFPIPLSKYKFNEFNALLYIAEEYVGSRITINITVQPREITPYTSTSFSGLPPQLFSMYGDGIAALACMELCANSTAQWVDKSKQQRFYEEYMKERRRAKSRNSRSFHI